MSKLFINESGEYRVAEDTVVIESARAALARRFRVGAPLLSSPRAMCEFLQLRLANRDYETFGIIHLDNRHRLIEVEDLFRGTIDGAPVYPREVMRSVFQHASAAVVFFHNHPSGSVDPSCADDLITRRLREALALVDVRVLDHFIVGHSVYSYAEHGRL